MKQHYSHILTFLFKHRYFKDGLFKSIDISYAEGTAKLIKDIGIIIKPFLGGFHLFASDPELLDAIDEEYPVRLYLSCKDTLHINYTELPTYSPINKILYFNNVTANSDSNDKGYQLNIEEFVGQNEVAQISQGKIKISSFDPKLVYGFKDNQGSEILYPNIRPSANYTDEYALSNLPEGLVSLFAETKEVEKFYYYPKAVWKKPHAILEIYTGKLFKHYKEKGIVNYNVEFKNRQTIWKYFFVTPVYQKFNKLSIVNKEKEQVFNGPQKQLVHNNSEAWVFESKNKIALTEFSDETYQLVDNYDSNLRSGKVILKNLVKASAEQLYRDENQPVEPAYSHIYI